MQLTTRFESTIETLYAVFARYPRPAKIEACRCGCTPADATDCLIAVPLRELPFADLTDFAFSALTTQGNVNDFRYLLPRLFEGFVLHPFLVDPEIPFGKLAYARWYEWPDDERQAIEEFLQAFWLDALRAYPPYEHFPSFAEIEELLASIARTGLSLEPYLAAWTKTRTPSADRHLVQLVASIGAEFAGGGFPQEGFWKGCAQQGRALRNWLLQAETLERIAQAEWLPEEDEFAHLFPAAWAVLQAENEEGKLAC